MVELVVIAGSLPRGVLESVLAMLIDLARHYKKPAFLHTSPKYASLALEAGPYLFIPDMRSRHILFGKEVDGIDDFLDSGKQILEKHGNIHIVIFTHRIENVVAITRETSFIVRPKDLKIVNMLGYGDAYLAGFIHAHIKGLQLVEQLRYASACGLTDVEDLYKEIKNINIIEQNINRIDVEIIK